jgi:hypothetical protein
MSTAHLALVRAVVAGDLTEVVRRVTANPALAAAASDVGATRQHGDR